MKRKRWTGCGTALVTPFRNGEVDCSGLRAVVMNQVEAGVDFLVPLGSTAETPCLSDEEKLEILRTVKSAAPDMPLVVGCGTNSFTQTVRNIRLLEPFSPDAFLVVAPYYNKPTQEGLYQYFKAVSESTDVPIILYNVPGRTGVNMSSATTLRLSALPGIVAIKEASGNIDQILEIINHAPAGFSVLSGNDDQTAELMRKGADGVISVASNIAPRQMVAMVRAMQRGDFAEGETLDVRLSRLFNDCFVESNPIPVKGALSIAGICTTEMRLPLTPATRETMESMKRTLEELEII